MINPYESPNVAQPGGRSQVFLKLNLRKLITPERVWLVLGLTGGAWLVFWAAVILLLNTDAFFRNGKVVIFLGIASYRFVGLAAILALLCTLVLPVVAALFGTTKQRIIGCIVVLPAIYLLLCMLWPSVFS
ncbi:MAG: hypothetical protein ACR2FY_04250 [Pirellulaceae bacterium]